MTQLDLPLISPTPISFMAAAAAAAAQHFNASITAEMKAAAMSVPAFSANNIHSSPTQKPTHQKSLSDVSGISVITPDYPSKTDKPKPHICDTCDRPFARLEHLKRHERSHTKEKPYTCPTCTRSFARRDLLLRHQQKLHTDTTAPAKPRAARRESQNSISDSKARVRKSSMVIGAPSGSMLNRPRANTMSHIDTAAFGNLATQSPKSARGRPALHHRPSDIFAASQNMMQQNANLQSEFFDPRNGLRLQTQNLIFGPNNTLRTAPAGQEMEWPLQTPDTINPSQLHFIEAPLSAPLDSPLSPSRAGAFSDISQMTMVEDDSWRNFGGELALMNTNETAIEASSPSAGSSDFFDINDLGIDRVMSHTQNPISWPEPLGNKGIPSYLLDMNSGYGSDLAQSPSAVPDMMDSNYLGQENTFGVPQSDVFGSILANSMHSAEFSPKIGSHSRSASVTSSVSGQISCLDSITDAAREILQNNLVPVGPQLITSRRSPSMGSPGRTANSGMTVLPSTADLKKFVAAYTKYFHPHLPFLHLPTLAFDSPHFAGMRFASQQSGMAGGGGCLMLAMAAIGAQYCFEPVVAGELFELSRRKVQLYLEECRQVELAHAHHGAQSTQPQTPLWLVQTTMLNVVFGLNCADKINEQIASTHCAALVQLAQSAHLDAPSHFSMDMHMHSQEAWEASLNGDSASAPWFAWKAAEEKKRTLYGVFILSSMLTSAYNVPATLANSQIQADLPCGEKLWAASTAREWYGLGGTQGLENQCIPFTDALSALLTAKFTQSERRDFSALPAPEFHASTFGCLVLINALHNFIWDTRMNKEGAWTLQDTERLCAHVEPALIQWQAVWASNPLHSMQRPNPHGMGPLSADCVPLLDLAYVRLHVSLGSSKEAFWSRRYDDMARELANGMIDADPSGYDPANLSMTGPLVAPDMREISLRTAAFHSIHSLEMASQLNVTFADFDSRELPLQAAMCTFDCIEVVAEWVTTLQERVGRFVGLIGRDHIDLDSAVARGVIDAVDRDLILKIDALLGDADQKVGLEEMVAAEEAAEDAANASGNGLSPSMASMQRQFSHMRAHSTASVPTRTPSPTPLKLKELHECGYGAKLLVVVGKMFNKSVIWPVYGLFHKCLLAQAYHMKGRAERSLVHANLQ